ncbi:MAG: hypothetical protein FJZ90_17840, partial [Chloroflexi bacterium]|nr:hypothetical protein [Chloroflexota bacterium]
MKRRGGFLRPMLEHEWSPWVFLVAAVLLGIISNAAYDLLAEPLGAGWTLLTGTAVLAILLGVFWLAYRTSQPPEPGQPLPSRRALIVLVSARSVETTPAYTALCHHAGTPENPGRLEHCYLIHDKLQGEEAKEPPDSSWSNAHKLFGLCRKRGVTPELLETRAYDCAETTRLCVAAWRRARQDACLPSREIIADVTGGTKEMTIGMCLAALQTG